MITFKVKGKLPELKEDWWKKTGEEWTPKLLLENRKMWPSERSYDGKPWKTLSPAYRNWKREKFGSLPMLRLTGKMLDTAFIKYDGKQYEVETTEYGSYHQFGTSRMPARPWMGVPDTSLKILTHLAITNIL